MRIAICLSGQPRTWHYTYPSLLNYFAGHELDLFFHTWSETPTAELEELISTYQPRAYVTEDRPLFLEGKRALASRFPISPPLSVFDMFHSIAASNTLALQAHALKPYDLICRSRFDLAFDGVWDGEAPPDGAVLLKKDNPGVPGGCNDKFAIGKPEPMAAYSGMIDWLPQGLQCFTPPCFDPRLLSTTILLRFAT